MCYILYSVMKNNTNNKKIWSDIKYGNNLYL